jgi:hypothetical protein
MAQLDMEIYVPQVNLGQEALGDPNWKKAVEEEYAALLKNGTWHLVPYKPRMNLIDCKWVFKIKRKVDRLTSIRVDW